MKSKFGLSFDRNLKEEEKMKKCLAIDIGGSKVLVGGARQKHRVRS